MRRLFAWLILLLLLSCSSKRAVPKDILPPEKMQLVFWDYMRAEVYIKDFVLLKQDSTLKDSAESARLQNRIFNYYHISKSDFYRSYDYYSNHPGLMTALVDSIIEKQNRQAIDVKRRLNPKQTSL